MTTEQKIREAFEKQYGFIADYEKAEQYPIFKAGYLTLLNELERNSSSYGVDLYVLPEGVTKC